MYLTINIYDDGFTGLLVASAVREVAEGKLHRSVRLNELQGRLQLL